GEDLGVSQRPDLLRPSRNRRGIAAGQTLIVGGGALGVGQVMSGQSGFDLVGVLAALSVVDLRDDRAALAAGHLRRVEADAALLGQGVGRAANLEITETEVVHHFAPLARTQVTARRRSGQFLTRCRIIGGGNLAACCGQRRRGACRESNCKRARDCRMPGNPRESTRQRRDAGVARHESIMAKAAAYCLPVAMTNGNAAAATESLDVTRCDTGGFRFGCSGFSRGSYVVFRSQRLLAQVVPLESQ